MRLIDADALIEDIKTKLWDWDTVDGITSSTVLKQTITDIGNAPTIDAYGEGYKQGRFDAEADMDYIVRCKDCKHYAFTDNRVPQERVWWCYYWGYEIGADDFCSNGERRGDE